MPTALLHWRCALTAPFHPYPGVVLNPARLFIQIFTRAHNDDGAVCFLWHFPSTGLEPGLPDVIRHTALWSSDFPLPLPGATVRSSCPHIYYRRIGWPQLIPQMAVLHSFANCALLDWRCRSPLLATRVTRSGTTAARMPSNRAGLRRAEVPCFDLRP